MNAPSQQPRPCDAVLGGQSPPPVGAVVLGGMEGVKRRLTGECLDGKIAALQEALNYGVDGLKLLDRIVETEIGLLQRTAYNLLWEKASKNQKKRLINYRLTFEYETITIDASGREIDRKRHQAQYQREDLGNEIILEMVAIPAGNFLMGSTLTEKWGTDSESPQHSVTVEPFFMGKFPIAQAQWRAIASLPQVKRKLNPDPSFFKGDNLPVENVSWHDAVEFCARLSQKTGRNYNLPSSAQWEYACRAFSITPFHFGTTITPAFANYNGNYTYASEPQGMYRRETTPVGSFLPNAFGLYDLHGNVWEWCADPWHDNYNNAPNDGQGVWESGGNRDRRLQRGGSWSFYPLYCRAARRGWFTADFRLRGFGFRVASDFF